MAIDPTTYVTINGHRYGLQRTTIDYASVVNLAEMSGMPIVTVKYPAADGMPRNRHLSPGQSCEVREGMRFNVAHTGCA